MYYNKSLKKYLDDLAAKIPAPGGGSAAACAAALGVALISMVVNFTKGKPKYAVYEKRLNNALSKSEKFRGQFLHFVDEDVLAYNSKNIRKATEIPLRVCRLCAEAITLCPELVITGNKNLVSDVAVAAVLLESAFMGAYFNVQVNLKMQGEKAVSKKVGSELKRLRKAVRKLRQDTEVSVGKIISG